MVSVDLFLRRYFATCARRARPGCVSLEARSGGGTLEQAQDAEAAHIYALTVMGKLEREGRLTPQCVNVLQRYYLGLSNDHVVMSKACMTGRSTVHLNPGESPPPGIEAEDLQSFCNWSRLARDVGLKNAKAARECWADARQAVWLELERRRDVS